MQFSAPVEGKAINRRIYELGKTGSLVANVMCIFWIRRQHTVDFGQDRVR